VQAWLAGLDDRDWPAFLQASALSVGFGIRRNDGEEWVVVAVEPDPDPDCAGHVFFERRTEVE
jgi:hypothetical protein